MRARLQKFLPLVLLALAMQVLAPIAACVAAGQAIADPFSAAAVICHGGSEQGPVGDRSDAPSAKAGACALCCIAQAGASLDAPAAVVFAAPIRHLERIVWQVAEAPLTAASSDAGAQARAPPLIS